MAVRPLCRYALPDELARFFHLSDDDFARIDTRDSVGAAASIKFEAITLSR